MAHTCRPLVRYVLLDAVALEARLPCGGLTDLEREPTLQSGVGLKISLAHEEMHEEPPRAGGGLARLLWQASMKAHSPLAQRVRPFLKSHTFFGGLPDPALDALIERGHTKAYTKGDVIYRRGEPGDSLMVILSGRIKVTNVSANAKEVVLNFLGAGDINGEIAALDGKERSADAVALE